MLTATLLLTLRSYMHFQAGKVNHQSVKRTVLRATCATCTFVLHVHVHSCYMYIVHVHVLRATCTCVPSWKGKSPGRKRNWKLTSIGSERRYQCLIIPNYGSSRPKLQVVGRRAQMGKRWASTNTYEVLCYTFEQAVQPS